MFVIYFFLIHFHCDTYTSPNKKNATKVYIKIDCQSVIAPLLYRTCTENQISYPLWNICFTNDLGYYNSTCVNTFRSFPHLWLITGFVTRLKRLVPLVEQELLNVQSTWVHPSFSGVHVTRSLVLCVCFVDRCLSFCPFSFGHCVVCSSISGFWLPLWYLQTLLKYILQCYNLNSHLWNLGDIPCYFIFSFGWWFQINVQII